MINNAIAVILFTATFSVFCLGLLWVARLVRLIRYRAILRRRLREISCWEQRKQSWAVVDGDGIRPVKRRF
jgi:hypothetical protein